MDSVFRTPNVNFVKNLLLAATLILFSACHLIGKGKNDIPPVDILLEDSTTHFNIANAPEGRPIILLYFSPDCEHCQKEIHGLLHHMDSLKKVQFYYITSDDFDEMKLFGQYYHLGKYRNITMGRDITYSFPGHFKAVAPPYLVVYDQNKRFRAALSGEVTASRVIGIVNDL